MNLKEQMEQRTNSIGLYDPIKIETWLRIADYVQKMNITNDKGKEFDENLQNLKKFLKGTEVSLEEKSAGATFFLHVGLATLLESIYNIKSTNSKNEHFTEYIYALSDIGMKTISFVGNTSKNMGNIQDIVKYVKNDEVFLSKAFTDGSFCIENSDDDPHLFELANLKNISYILYVVLAIKNENSKILRANANIMDFNGILPSKSDIMEAKQPDIIYNSICEWQVTDKTAVKLKFKPYDKKKAL